ncbi:MAG: Xaa-Pro peptidase family protein [Bacillota bacterium]
MQLEQEIARRVQLFQQQLRENGIDGALLVQNADQVYFTGTCQQAHLYIPAEGRPLYMVRRDVGRAEAESRGCTVVPLRSFREIKDIIRAAGLPLPERLGLEGDVLPLAYYLQYQKNLPPFVPLDCTPLIRKLRAVKSAFELEYLRLAGRMMDEVMGEVPGFLAPGVTEVELAGIFEAQARRRGHEGFVRMRGVNAEVFYGHFLGGPSATVTSGFDGVVGGPGLSPAFPYGAGKREIRAGEPVLIDYPGVWHGYIVDITRIFVIGSLDRELGRAHETALEIQEALCGAARPGVTCGELWEIAAAGAARAGLERHFMGYHNPVRFVGHGVGLELNDLPVIAAGDPTPLEAGMVIALEPKFVFPGRGVVGVENTFVVREDGLERLTNFPDHVHFVRPAS